MPARRVDCWLRTLAAPGGIITCSSHPNNPEMPATPRQRLQHPRRIPAQPTLSHQNPAIIAPAPKIHLYSSMHDLPPAPHTRVPFNVEISCGRMQSHHMCQSVQGSAALVTTCSALGVQPRRASQRGSTFAREAHLEALAQRDVVVAGGGGASQCGGGDAAAWRVGDTDTPPGGRARMRHRRASQDARRLHH
jgi:hypothetical protein